MDTTVTVKTKYGEINYEFKTAKDGEAFKKDLEKDDKRIKVTIIKEPKENEDI